MKSINHYKRKLSRSCYFRKIDRECESAVLSDFQKKCGLNADESAMIYFKYKNQIKQSYSLDCFKLVSYVLATSAIICLVIAGIAITFITLHLGGADNNLFKLINDFIYVPTIVFSVYLTLPFLAIYNLIGLLAGKIKLRNYRYNWLMCLLHFAITCCFFAYIVFLYTI